MSQTGYVPPPNATAPGELVNRLPTLLLTTEHVEQLVAGINIGTISDLDVASAVDAGEDVDEEAKDVMFANVISTAIMQRTHDFTRAVGEPAAASASLRVVDPTPCHCRGGRTPEAD